MSRWIVLLCLATTVALSLACSSGSDLNDASRIPTTDVFNDPLPEDIKNSFKAISGGSMSIGGGNATTYLDPTGASVSFATDISLIDSFEDSQATDLALQETSDGQGTLTTIDSISMMDSEVTVSMSTSFLNAIGRNSDELTAAGEGETSSFTEVTTIYKAIMSDITTCGIDRFELGEPTNDVVTDFSGFFVGASGKPNAWDGYVDPYVTIQQKPRQSAHGEVQTSSFAVANNRDNYPMVYVTQTEAKEFCQWLGPQYRLPTWQEWQWAAKGGAASYQFPTSTGNLFNVTTSSKLANVQYQNGQPAGTTPVKSTGANPFGLHDMAGNVAEWTYFTAEDQQAGATIPYGTSSFVLGGSFKSKKPIYSTSWFRWVLASEGVWADDLGFRVVFDTSRGNSIADYENINRTKAE